MKHTKLLLTVLIMLLMCIPMAYATYELGDAVADFTYTTYDGKTSSLSEALEGKDAVLLNFWATWCEPCRNEFPHIQAAYEKYGDRVEVIALSKEVTDDDATLAAFAEAMGLTFPIGRSGELKSLFDTSGIPLTAIIDRFGNICYLREGSFSTAEQIGRILEAVIGDHYTETTLYYDIPPQVVNVAPSTEAELSAALNVAGGQLTFENGTGIFDWPMIVTEMDGRTVVQTTNSGTIGGYALLKTSVSAKAGDALAMTFKVSGAAGFDLLQMVVNGETVKAFGGEEDWMTYAYEIPADGTYDVELVFENQEIFSTGVDMAWVDDVALLTGDEAKAALANNIQYPVSDTWGIKPVEGSRVEITDPTGVLYAYCGDVFYITPNVPVQFEIFVPAGYDPECVLVMCNYDGEIHSLADCLVDGRYLITFGLDTMDTTGYSESTVMLYPSIYDNPIATATYFKDEENLEALIAGLTKDANGEVLGTWAYVEDDAAATAATRLTEAQYVVKYVDQNGAPVQGVMVQVCDEETCQVFVTDANGECAFTLAPYAWEIHTLKVPDGYTGDTTTITYAPVAGGEMVFELVKN